MLHTLLQTAWKASLLAATLGFVVAGSGPSRADSPTPLACPGPTTPNPLVLPAGTYQLAGSCVIGTPFGIQGAGLGLTFIEGNGADRLFQIDAGFSLSGLTLSGGHAAGPGGAVWVQAGNLFLRDVGVVHSSSAVAGGGIAAAAGTDVAISNSVLAGDTAPDGGGIAFGEPAPAAVTGQGQDGQPSNQGGGELTVDQSTLSNDSAPVSGGGAIEMIQDSALITDSTLASDSGKTGGGVLQAGGATTLRNDTLVSDQAAAGGGVAVLGGTASFDNATLNGNTATVGADLDSGVAGSALQTVNTIFGSGPPACAGSVDSLGHNLDRGTTCGNGPGDRHDVAPGLGPLAANGGATETEAVLAGSPAIDSGAPAECPGTDQRGVSRDVPCDIGAYESKLTSQPPPTPAPSPGHHPSPAPTPHGAVLGVQVGLPDTGAPARPASRAGSILWAALVGGLAQLLGAS